VDAGGDAVTGSADELEVAGEPVKQRKPRWKAEGKETAKKTKKTKLLNTIYFSSVSSHIC